VVIDSAAVVFKANLFTVSEYGIASRETILRDIESQEVIFLKTKYKTFSFLKIDFSQPYRSSDNARSTLVRNCFYYIAFNKIKNKFYRLGGFDALDIEDFIKDLESQEGVNVVDWENGNEVEGIAIECFYEYIHLNKKKRSKKKFTCFECCSENTRTYYIEY
jgi:hypothetical protein